nr:hypothetical protein [Mitsuokella multacida]
MNSSKGYYRRIKAIRPDLLSYDGDQLLSVIEDDIESIKRTEPEKVKEAEDVILWCEKEFDRHLNCMSCKQLRIVVASLIDWGTSEARREYWRKRWERWWERNA